MRQIVTVLIAAALPGAAFAGSPEELAVSGQAGFAGAAAFQPDLGALRKAYQAQQADVWQALEPVSVIVSLPGLLNNMRRTWVSFQANGAIVRMFGIRAQNNSGEKGWFLGFTLDDGPAVFHRAYDALSWLSVNRKITTTFNDCRFELRTRPPRLPPYSSPNRVRVLIKPTDPMGPEIDFTAAELAQGVYDAGFPVSLGGREYRLIYSENIDEQKEQVINFVKGKEETEEKIRAVYNGQRSIVLLFKDKKGEFLSYGWLLHNIPIDRFLLDTPKEKKGTEETGKVGPHFGLMINSFGDLELRIYPAAD